MKTHNHHPLWHNQPLRLNEEQLQNPNLVLNDFFQCYHLHEVREILWEWLTEAVSSPNSHSSDHHERNNYMFFYEKMEALVEAAWIMNRGISQAPVSARHVNKKAAINQVSEIRVKSASEPAKTAKPTHPGRFSKPARLIEKASSHPEEVIAEVFSHAPLDELQGYLLPNWLRVAVINTESPYSAGKGREVLYEFYDQLLQIVEVLFLFTGKSTDTNFIALSPLQQNNPSLVLNSFFQQFSIDYLRRELADFLDAGIGYEGNYPNGFTPWQAWLAYNHVHCLTEAAYQLYINQQMESVSNTLSKQPVVLAEAE